MLFSFGALVGRQARAVHQIGRARRPSHCMIWRIGLPAMAVLPHRVGPGETGTFNAAIGMPLFPMYERPTGPECAGRRGSRVP